MPQNGNPSQFTSSGEATTAEAHPHPALPAPLAWGVGFAAIAAGIALGHRVRTAASRAWQSYAKEIGGEVEMKTRLSPSFVSGNIAGRAVFMETSTNNDDDAPYYHTRVSTPVSNPSHVVMGLRRKSMLEEAQTRNETPTFAFGDTDFDKRFYLVVNYPSALADLLGPEVRKGLLKYSDVEVYVKRNVVEWRRAGEVSDVASIRWLNALIVEIAAKLDAMAVRSVTLTQLLADEELVSKSI